MDEQTEYGGRTLKQHRNFGFQITMTRYLREKSAEIKLERGQGKHQDTLATPTEITQMRGVVGKLNCASREGMPQGAGDASLLAGTLPTPKVKDLTAANAALRRLLQNDAPIQIKPIPLDRLGLLSFSDSSLGNAGQGKAQLANIVCAVDKSIHLGKEADISIVAYRSHKKTRAASSTLLNESCALSETLADAAWVAAWFGLAKNLDYDLRRRDHLNREIKITSILSEKDCELDIASITDAKSLYDALTQEQYTGAEKRAALEICVIRDSLEAMGGKARTYNHFWNS